MIALHSSLVMNEVLSGNYLCKSQVNGLLVFHCPFSMFSKEIFNIVRTKMLHSKPLLTINLHSQLAIDSKWRC